MKDLRVAVLMGGPSAEAEVSRKSGAMVVAALRDAGMSVVPVDIQGTAVNVPADVFREFWKTTAWRIPARIPARVREHSIKFWQKNVFSRREFRRRNR